MCYSSSPPHSQRFPQLNLKSHVRLSDEIQGIDPSSRVHGSRSVKRDVIECVRLALCVCVCVRACVRAAAAAPLTPASALLPRREATNGW